jgi:hypothetical protein
MNRIAANTPFKSSKYMDFGLEFSMLLIGFYIAPDE